MAEYKSSLILNRIVFDKIIFERSGFKNDEKFNFELEVYIGEKTNNEYRVTLILNGKKENEYTVNISLSGFFRIDMGEEKEISEKLINKNAVAILMPYLRSELTLLTAQPGTDSVVLQPFNVSKMMD